MKVKWAFKFTLTMEERINLDHTISSQPASGNTTLKHIYHYGKQFLKGAALFGIGALAYLGGRRFFSGSSTSEEATQLTSSKNPLTKPKNQQVNILDVKDYGKSSSLKKRALNQDILVNTYRNGDQVTPRVAKLTNGNLVVVWNNLNTDYKKPGVYAQIISPPGVKVASEILIHNNSDVSTGLNLWQDGPEVAALSNGDFVVVRTGRVDLGDLDDECVTAHHMTPQGAYRIPGFLVNNYTEGNQHLPKIAAFKDGGYVVVWTSGPRRSSDVPQDGDGAGIYAQLFDNNSTRIGAEFRVNQATYDNQVSPDLIILDNNNFLVTWESRRMFQTREVYASEFLKNGTRVKNEFRINKIETGDQIAPRVVQFGNGNLLFSWLVGGRYDNHQRSRLFNSSFYPLTDDLIGAWGLTWATSAVTLQSGDVIIVAGASPLMLDPFANPIGNSFGFNNTEPVSGKVVMAQLDNGNFAFVWQSGTSSSSSKPFGYDIYTRIIENQEQLYIQGVSNQRTYTEDNSYSFNQNSWQLAGVIYNPTLNLTLTLNNETVGTLNTPTEGNIVSTFNATTGVWRAQGIMVEMNKLIPRIVFTPSQDHDQDVTLTVEAVDSLGSGNPKRQTWGTITLNAIPVNDPPVLVNNKIKVNQGESLMLDDTHLKTTDVDNQLYQIRYIVSNLQNGL